MAHKQSPGSSYRIDRRYEGVGRIAVVSGATTKDGYRKRLSCLETLFEQGRLDVLRAVERRTLTVTEVYGAMREDRLDAVMASLNPNPEDALFWPTIEAWLGPEDGRGVTKRRYACTVAKLRRVGIAASESTSGLTVAQLRLVDWADLHARWGGSKADRNHLRRTMGKFLTDHLGDVYHPLRRAVVKAIPKLKEKPRTPDISPGLFKTVMVHVPDHVRPAFWAIVACGLRVGEYLALQPEHLHPITKSVTVPGTKTDESDNTVSVDPRLWAWVVAGVPAPVRYRWLRLYWKRALKAAGVDTSLRIHDLRHCSGQWAVNEGVAEVHVQTFLRHADASMTRNYTRQKQTGIVSSALADALEVA
jgi:integrase